MSCKNCKHFYADTEKPDKFGNIYGSCKRYPPVFVSAAYCKTSENYDEPYSPARWDWPIVEQGNSCGEFMECP